MFGFGPLGKFALGQASDPIFVGGQPFAEPVRSRIAPRLAIALIASGAIGPVLNDTQLTSKLESRWHQAWSEPVRLKPGLKTHLQQFFTTDTIVLPEQRQLEWFTWLSEPIRLKRGLSSTLQQFTTQDTRWIPNPSLFEEGWFNWLSEPVRLKILLPTKEQHYFEFEPEPPEFIEIPWFNWLSEPVRLPIGLKAWLQQTTAYYPRLLPNPNITATMAATEINSDIALLGIITYNQATKAIVSIKEISATNSGAASIEET